MIQVDCQAFSNASVSDVYSLINTPLERYISRDDGEAAFFLHHRMRAFDWLDEARERSFAERGLIAIEFEKRRLWEYLDDPQTGHPFTSFNAWASSRANGARSTTFEAKRDLEALKDVPPAELRGMAKGNLKVLKQLSTAVRREPAILEAARTLPTAQFLEHIEQSHPDQHIEAPVTLKFAPERSGARKVEEAIQWAINHDLAGSRDEALVRIAEAALEGWEIAEEIDQIGIWDIPTEE